MQLRLDAADRLVELVEERRGAVPVEDAARALFALAHLPEGMARSLLDDVVAGDARLAWRGGCVALETTDAERVLLEEATFCVVDLETTGLSPARSRICEIGAVRVEPSSSRGTFQTLVNPRERLPLQIAALTGIDAARSPSRARHRVSRRSGSWRSRGRPSSSPTTRASTWRSSTTRCCASPGGGLPGPSSTPSGSRGSSSPAAARASGSPRSRTSSAPPRGRATARCPMRKPPPRSCCSSSGSHRSAARAASATSSSSRRRADAASTESARSRSAPRRSPASTSSATRTIRCSTSAARATCARGCARTSARSVSVLGRGRACGSRVDRVARARLGARSGARGAAAAARAAAAGERALDAAGSLRLPRHARRPRRRHEDADAVRAAEEPAPRAARRPRARARRARPPARRAPATASKAPCARRGAALRGRGAAARPRRRRRSPRGGARAAPAPACCGALPRGARRGAGIPPRLLRGARPGRGGADGPAGAEGSSSTRAWRRRAAQSRRSLPRMPTSSLVVAQFLRRPPPELRVLSFDEIDRRAVA